VNIVFTTRHQSQILRFVWTTKVFAVFQLHIQQSEKLPCGPSIIDCSFSGVSESMNTTFSLFSGEKLRRLNALQALGKTVCLITLFKFDIGLGLGLTHPAGSPASVKQSPNLAVSKFPLAQIRSR